MTARSRKSDRFLEGETIDPERAAPARVLVPAAFLVLGPTLLVVSGLWRQWSLGAWVIAISIFLLYAFGVLIFHMTANKWLLGQRRANGRCERCGYSLADTPGTSCPECNHDNLWRKKS